MEEYLIGFATTNITPPLHLNVRVGGYIRLHKVSKKVLEFLFARAICFRSTDPTQSLLVIACDLVGFQYRIARIIRRIISRRTGMPMARIILHFTHSHSSPDTIGIFPNHLRNLLTFDVQYDVVQYIMHHVIRAGINAFEHAVPARIGYGTTSLPEPPLAILRRPPRELLNLPVRFLKIESPGGALTGIIVNYQAHPTQMPGYNADIHPEYPGMVAKALFTRYPALKFAAYFNGASGDVTIHGYKGGYRHEGESREDAMVNAIKTVELLGQRFADLVIKAIDDVKTEPLTSVEVKRRFIFPRIGRVRSIWNRLPLYKTLGGKSRMLLHELRDALRIAMFYKLYKLLNGRDLPMLNVVKNGRHAHHQTELFVARINDIYWFSSPGEPFIMYQDALAKLLPSGKFIFSQMNETCGYIYPWSFYVQGGYEKFFSFDALFGEYLVSTFKQTFERIEVTV